MKKALLAALIVVSVSVSSVFAQQQKGYDSVCFAFNNWICDESVDVVGLRLTLPYGECESLTGFDLGLWGTCQNMYGLQINLIRNNVIDQMAGIQIGCVNLAGDAFGAQVGLWNQNLKAGTFSVGLVNIADHVDGFQIGLINRTETINGFQVGIVNVIRSSSVPFCPLVNFTFQ